MILLVLIDYQICLGWVEIVAAFDWPWVAPSVTVSVQVVLLLRNALAIALEWWQ